MKVYELIKQLSAVDQDLEVRAEEPNAGGDMSVISVDVMSYHLKDSHSYLLLLTDD